MDNKSNSNLSQPLSQILIRKGSLRPAIDWDGNNSELASNRSLDSIVSRENRKYERQLEKQELERLKLQNLASSGNDQNTPAFNKALPNFNVSMSISHRSQGGALGDGLDP